jgi:hypothetical protein
MKVTIPLGTQDGDLQCAAPAAAPARRSLAPAAGHAALPPGGGRGAGGGSSSGHNGLVASSPGGTAAALRQNSLTALILVIPSSIDSLSDAFGSISNAVDFRSTFGSGGSGGGGGKGNAAATTGSSSGSESGYAGLVGALSAYINANTITIAVITAVSASVGNVVAASSVSNTASLTNAFQMVGHAQCEMSEMRSPLARAYTRTQCLFCVRSDDTGMKEQHARVCLCKYVYVLCVYACVYVLILLAYVCVCMCACLYVPNHRHVCLLTEN